MSPALIFTVWIIRLTLVTSVWNSPGSLLANSCKYCAVGEHNNTLFLIGGQVDGMEPITEYQFSTTHALNFISQNLVNLTLDLYGYGQTYTQQDEMVYMLYPTDGIQPSSITKIATFNMKTHQLTDNWMELTLQTKVDYYGCLASFANYLYIAGGAARWGPTHATLQILDLTTYEWIQNAPSLQDARSSSSCLVHNNILWIFGGAVIGGDKVQTNERINIIDITQNTWNYTAPLTIGITGSRAAVLKDMIYIIGGTHAGSNQQRWDVHVLDTNTETMSVSAELLAYPIIFCSVYVLNDIIYVFGGTSYGSYSDKWMYYTLPTVAPTTEPTSATPTSSPIPGPTYTPTPEPTTTANPSKTPTADPVTKDSAVNPKTSASNAIESSISPQIVNRKNPTPEPDTVVLNLLLGAFVSIAIIVVLYVLLNCYFHRKKKMKEHVVDLVVEHVDGQVQHEMMNTHVSQLIQQEMDFERDLVVSWITNAVKLPQYVDMFVSQGYDCMRAIQAIRTRDELTSLGVKLPGHQILILAEIDKIQGTEFMTKGQTKGNARISQSENNEDPSLEKMQGTVEGVYNDNGNKADKQLTVEGDVGYQTQRCTDFEQHTGADRLLWENPTHGFIS
eukprot:755533_1